jgi:hypothetical protein
MSATADISQAGVRRHHSFDHLAGAEREKELLRTRRAVQEYLDRPRSEFPPCEIRYGERVVPIHVVDAAFARCRLDRISSQTKHCDFDWIAAMAIYLPGCIVAENDRIKNFEPMPRLLGGEGSKMFERDCREVGGHAAVDACGRGLSAG